MVPLSGLPCSLRIRRGRWKRKARENLEAAERLLGGDPCPNAAASRAYYAAYQACWEMLRRRGIEPPEVRPEKRYFPHRELPGLTLRHGVLDTEAASDLRFLETARVSADYDDVGSLDVATARTAIECAAGIVRGLGDAENE